MVLDIPFKVHSDPATHEFRRYCLLNGLDDIGLTLQHRGQNCCLRGPARPVDMPIDMNDRTMVSEFFRTAVS